MNTNAYQILNGIRIAVTAIAVLLTFAFSIGTDAMANMPAQLACVALIVALKSAK